MSLILVTSIFLRIIALALSIALVRRFKRGSLLFLSVLFLMMTVRQSLTFLKYKGMSLPTWLIQFEEFPGLVVSVIGLLAVAFLKHFLEERETLLARAIENEAKYRNIVLLATEGILVGTTEGMIVEVNERACHLLGFSRQELIGLPVKDLFFPEDLQKSPLRFHELLEGQTLRAVRRLRRKDGTPIVVELSGRRLPDGRIQAVIYDLSEHMALRQALEESRERFRILSEATFEGVLIHENGIIVDVNRQFADMVGYDRTSLIGKNALDLVVPECRATVEQNILSGIETPYETMGVRKNGEVFPVEIQARILDTGGRKLRVAVVRDITERKRVLAELQKRQTLLEEAEELANLGSFEWFIGDDTMVFSEMLQKLLGLQANLEPPTLDTFVQRFHPEDRDTLRAAFESLRQGEQSLALEMRLQQNAHDTRVVAIKARRAAPTESGVARATGVCRDITEERMAKERLRLQIERTEKLLNATLDGFILADDRGRIIDVNPSYCRMVGYSKDELLTMSIFDLEAILSPEQIQEKIQDMVAKGGARFETQHRAKDGSVIDLDVSITIFQVQSGALVAAFVRDITERKIAETALREYADRLSILHRLEQGILAAQSPEAIARESLRHLQDYLGCIGASVTVFDSKKGTMRVLVTHPGNGVIPSHPPVPVPNGRWLATLENKKQVRLQPREARSVADKTLPGLTLERSPALLSIPLATQRGLLGALNLAFDDREPLPEERLTIAEEIAAELAIAIQQADMIQQIQKHTHELEQRVETRTRELKEAVAELESFAYTVSHDLRAPLRAMQGFAQALQEDYGDRLDPQAENYIRRIVEAVRRMDDLIQDLLSYSRVSRETITVSTVFLSKIVQKVLQELEQEIKNAEAHIEVQEPLHQVRGNTTLLTQVVSNLISNAIKFRRSDRPATVRIWTEQTGNRVRFYVRDDGIGIEPEHQERIFRVFERLHGIELYPGTGIGLAIVRRAIERMGGNVGVQSQPGEGSLFWFELPGGTTAEN